MHPTCIFNDNYCDCGDDEPFSSACSLFIPSYRRVFQCIDTRFFNQTMYLSRVGDGICDCCDGSDESHEKSRNNAVSCPNICEKLGKDLRSEAGSSVILKERGLVEKEIRLKNGQTQLYDLKNGMRKAGRLIPELEKRLSEYKIDLLKEEEIEQKELEVSVNKSRMLFKDAFVLFSMDNLQKLLAVITLLSKEEGVEAILVECDDKYEGDGGGDPDDTLAFSLVGQVKNEISEDVDNQMSKYTHDISNTMIQNMIKALSLKRLSIENLIEVSTHAISRALNGGLTLAQCFHGTDSKFPSNDFLDNFPVSPVAVMKSGIKREKGEFLRSKIIETNEEIASLREGGKDGQKYKDIDFGPNNLLFSIYEKCFSYTDNEYTYVFCPFGSAKQKDTLLGNYEKYEIIQTDKSSIESDRVDGINLNNDNDEKIVNLFFNNGEKCWNTQKPRTFVLKLECSDEEKIIDVNEPEMCSYSATLLSPLGCF